MKYVLFLMFAATSLLASEPATAINQFGASLLRMLAKDNSNVCISPYSIELALAMAYEGSRGETRTQMADVLGLPVRGPQADFSSLNLAVGKAGEEAVTLESANRLFGQAGFALRKEYLALLKKNYSGRLEVLDFKANPVQAAKTINRWVEKETRDRIRNLVPADALGAKTTLVLVNALYLKADWASPFEKNMTKPRPFHIQGKQKATDVPSMQRVGEYGYLKGEGFTAITLDYLGSQLQFLVLLPDDVDGLPKIEAGLNAKLLSQCANLELKRIELTLPKLKLEPKFALREPLVQMGMKAAFDIPGGSADFDGIAPKKSSDYLYISQVFHQTFLEVDEKGTEAAAAATAVVMTRYSAAAAPATKVQVDRPFVFAIQEKSTGVCLFLGRVNDPR